ncbi:cell wall-active antibiotics response protein LiaF [Thermoflavimicrobium dichotomicum]|uniref:Cell wall-active antibiotics response 4TMS YvqF n=1 Tax=Thermoflavimicrobium dichotomicum TaxID=46223 RepID=A0A1I3U4C4_9BACL|nr:cell wall-active antibiotics response protein LiaF [Thermoflavimicrobium dichotomicum]SFJ76736.1 Cell wall-active antibiotics response 4TMS YvqF [Thermoflavimicrobium dichotomicum]
MRRLQKRKYIRLSCFLGVILLALLLQLFMQVNAFGLLFSLLFFFVGFHLFRSGSKNRDRNKQWIGKFHRLESNYELQDLQISHGFTDVKLDLTKAMISEGEKQIMISGWIGDVNIYLPYDLEVSVDASVTLGKLEVLGREARGFRPHLETETPGYAMSKRKVKILVSVLFGDVSVRCL